MTMEIFTTDRLKGDLIIWLSDVCDDGYGRLFRDMPLDERDAILSDLVSSATTTLEGGVHVLTLREKYRRVDVPYYDFKMVRLHFSIEIADPFTDEVFIFKGSGIFDESTHQ